MRTGKCKNRGAPICFSLPLSSVRSVSEAPQAVNGSLSYLRDSWVRRDRKSSLYIDQASSEIFFYFFFSWLPHALCRNAAVLLLRWVCVCVCGGKSWCWYFTHSGCQTQSRLSLWVSHRSRRWSALNTRVVACAAWKPGLVIVVLFPPASFVSLGHGSIVLLACYKPAGWTGLDILFCCRLVDMCKITPFIDVCLVSN